MSDTPTPQTVPENCYCQLDGVVELLSRKYAMQVVCAVAHLGPVRYGDLSDAFLDDVSSSTLSARLEELTETGLLSRERYDEIPPRVEYDITEEGAELNERLEPLLQWAETHDIDA